jgi:Domain of unknown function (DUF5658)
MSRNGSDFDPESNERRHGERRRRRVSFVWPERRSGFDRRGSASPGRVAVAFEGLLVGLRDSPAAVRVLLLTVNMLNLADFALTMNALAMGGGEANPIMRSLFDVNPVYAGIFKIFVILAVSLVIWRFRRYRSALQIALVLVVIFLGVFFYHILGLIAFG